MTTLADTPTTWLEGPSLSTLHTLAIFAGIPLLVILTISLLVYAPSWVHGPRYRPGQPWDAKSEWFSGSVAASPSGGLAPAGAGSDASLVVPPAPTAQGSTAQGSTAPGSTAPGSTEQGSGVAGTGGASAGW